MAALTLPTVSVATTVIVVSPLTARGTVTLAPITVVGGMVIAPEAL